MKGQPKHLPYSIDSTCRSGRYENYWKKVALGLVLKHCAPAGKTVLDYGCGRGETLQYFGEAGFLVRGTDVDPECVRLSSAFGGATMLNPDDPLGQFGRKSFDIVTCFHVLEHVETPRRTLAALAEIARQFVVLAVPNLRYLHQITARNINLAHVNEGHLHGWDHWHLLNLAQRFCGLELVEWASDATMLPLLSNLSQRVFGTSATMWLEINIFKTLFPFHSISIIGLFRPVRKDSQRRDDGLQQGLQSPPNMG
jgi:SAM-dependent methyltransferase